MKSTMKRIRSIALAGFFTVLVLLIPVIMQFFMEKDVGKLTYSSFEVVATIEEDGDLYIKESFHLDVDNKHTYLREINFDKNQNYHPMNQSSLSDVTIRVHNNGEQYTTTGGNRLQNEKVLIAFEGQRDELGDVITPIDRGNFPFVIYLKDGINDSTLYEIEYRIVDAVTVYQDISELNWKLIPILDSVRKNAKVTIRYPENTFGFAEKNDSNQASKIFYYGHGTSHASFEPVGESKNSLSMRADVLSSEEEIEVRTFFPTSMMKDVVETDSNYIKENGLETILALEDKILRLEQSAVTERNWVLYGTSAAAIVLFVGLLVAWIHVYKKYDKEHVSSFDSEYMRELPADYGPALMGYLVHFKEIGKDDLTATLLDLIRRKYILIHTEGVVLTDENPNYQMELNDEQPLDDLKEHERYVLHWFFETIAEDGKKLALEDIENYLETEKNAIQYGQQNRTWIRLTKKESDKEMFFDDIESKVRIYTGVGIFGVILLLLYFFGCIRYAAPLSFSIVMIISLAMIVMFCVYIPTIKRRSIKGNEDYVRWCAFEKFLRDFGTFEDDPVASVAVWEHYLVYATSFGIADLVEKQLRLRFSSKDGSATQPELSDLFIQHYFYSRFRYRMYNTFRISTNTIQMAQMERMRKSASSGGRGGFGGGSSFGGGGGHSSVR